jgi:hypothetical protein
MSLKVSYSDVRLRCVQVWCDEGRLSLRMRVQGNIWEDNWHNARPCPVRRQKRLFDETKEAEKVYNSSFIHVI